MMEKNKKMLTVKKRTLCFFIFLTFLLFLRAVSFGEKGQSTLKWKKNENAIAYQVQIKDLNDKILIDKRVKENTLVLVLKLGDYKVRIAKINKFNKVDYWSKWFPLSIKKFQRYYRKTEKSFSKLGLSVVLGMGYFHILPKWNNYYNSSIKGINGIVEFGLASISYFNKSSILRYMNIELDTSYYSFNSINKTNQVKSTLNQLLFGGNISFSTNFKYPLNYTARFGVGMTKTKLNYFTYDNNGNITEKRSSPSNDIYYKTGISVEYDFYQTFFIESGVDYYKIFYISNSFKAFKSYILLGTRF